MPNIHDTGDCAKRLFPDFRLLAQIGGGAYGRICLAVDDAGTHRAIKFVARDDVESNTRYSREHRAIRLVQTLPDLPPSIVPILEMRTDSEVGFGYVMVLADSERPLWQDHPEEYRPKTLRGELVARRALPLAECLDIGIRLSEALDFLQRHRLVHRDIKPSNIIYIQGKPVLADVGLLADTREADSIVGTPGYAPAEQHGHFSGDMYSLGILLTEISTGRSADECGFSPVEESDTDAPGYARWLDILSRACDPNPAKRHQTAAALLHELEAFRIQPLQTRHPWRRAPDKIFKTTALIVGLGGAAYWAWLRARPLLPEVPTPSSDSAAGISAARADPGSPWENMQHELERRIEAGAFNEPPNLPLQPHPSTRTHFTIPDRAGDRGAVIQAYADKILVGTGNAGSLDDWRIVLYYHPIQLGTQGLFLLPLEPFDPAEQAQGPPLRTWPPDASELPPIHRSAAIPRAILENHAPHHYPVWVFLTTDAPEKWEAWMEDNAPILTNRTLAFYRFQQAWYQHYRFAHNAPSGNPAYDKAMEEIKILLGEELFRRSEK